MDVRYSELANTIVKNIKDGIYPVGSRLPSEVDFARQFDVSRTTIRSALRVVEELGLISRKRRAGTVVEAAKPASQYSKSLHSIEDLVNYASKTIRNVLDISEIICDDALATTLECKAGKRWLRVQILRTELTDRDHPICWTDAYMDPDDGRAILDLIKDGSGLLCHFIEQRTGRTVIDLKQQVGATQVPAAVAHLLQVEADSVGLEITRHYLDQAKKVFLITVNIYPKDKFKFTFWIHRDKH
ncbi:GntR family transcriptional regulator [Advenella kashmirensis WT001]|uniref:GntR family transcriptional regulator n=1 Tax=Advenella kashmirensis (strain DSM 17095 / LMG 22695 / WT001) TaxID=1036672 RepID=I3U952_ADVKW|nr:GntR family transcriptional regulator [Advenella kashmirensis]AFK61540.1 GntR family transcriptional regulator [Advenella kashmirensis WT001]